MGVIWCVYCDGVDGIVYFFEYFVIIVVFFGICEGGMFFCVLSFINVVYGDDVLFVIWFVGVCWVVGIFIIDIDVIKLNFFVDGVIWVSGNVICCLVVDVGCSGCFEEGMMSWMFGYI